MSDTGWLKLHRQIVDCWVWDDNEPYTKAQAWIYLLLIVNHEAATTYFDGELVTVNAGQKITSVRKLADKFRWSRTKVTHFLSLLEQDNMIKVESDTKKTLLTIVNYAKYQVGEPQKSHEKDSKEPQKSHTEATEKPQKDTNKNEKNDKNEKNNIPPIIPHGDNEKSKRFIPPSVEEVNDYCRERGNDIDGEAFVSFYQSKGWRVGSSGMKDWKAAIRTWESKRGFKPKPKQEKPPKPQMDDNEEMTDEEWLAFMRSLDESENQ